MTHGRNASGFFMLVALCACFGFMPCGVRAEGITRELVEALYKESDRIAILEPTKCSAFLEKHLHPNIKTTVDLTTTMEGRPPQVKHIIKTKSDIINTCIQDLQMGVIVSHINTTITDFTTEPDGSVRTKIIGTSDAHAAFKGPNGQRALVNLNTEAACEDALALSPQGILQFTRTTCRANMVQKVHM